MHYSRPRRHARVERRNPTPQPGRAGRVPLTCRRSSRHQRRMDISVLPNNNHPEKFLQLDVGTLEATHGTFQLGALVSTQRRWQNRVYEQRERAPRSGARSLLPLEDHAALRVDTYLEKHITPGTLKSNIRSNPLFVDTKPAHALHGKSAPSWTVTEHDTRSAHGGLAAYLKRDEMTPKDLDFWLEELYTPGFDSLLKRKETERRRKRLCRVLLSVTMSVCVVLVVVVVPVVLLQND